MIPYFDLHGEQTKFWRLRYLEDTRRGFDLVCGKKALRYVQAVGTLNEVYLPPFADWSKIAVDSERPVLITEGELKAACATKHGPTPTIGLGGVWSFKSGAQMLKMLPGLEAFAWRDRSVIICYDSDAATNPKVVQAENALAKELSERGANVYIARLPPAADGGKMGLDDFIVAHGAEALEQVLADAPPYAECRALREMNERVVHVRTPGAIYSYADERFFTLTEFTNLAYATYTHLERVDEKKTRVVATAAAWVKWPARAELRKVVFTPGAQRVVGQDFNLWRGWGVEPAKGDVKPWNELLDHLFADSEPAARRWFEQWCAYPLQNPGGKMSSAAVLWGRVQGSGKTLIGITLRRIYGFGHSVLLTDKSLRDERMTWAENTQFALADDITASDNRVLMNKLKTMVTQEEIMVDPKFIHPYKIKDCINYYVTSNDADVIYMDDEDRRFFIHEVVACRLTDRFKDDYVKWMKGAGPSYVFQHLLALDMTGFDPFGPALETAAKAEMQRVSKSDLAAWVDELRVNADVLLKIKSDLFTAKELLAFYENGTQGRVKVGGMVRELKKAGYKHPGQHDTVFVTAVGAHRLFAIRNVEFWRNQPAKEIIAHFEKGRQLVKAKF